MRRPPRPLLLLLPLVLCALCSTSCRKPGAAAPASKVVVFHAGSLSIPFREIAAAFEAAHPGVKVEREASGSRAAARKISDLGRPCDVMVSADTTVIEELLLGAHADWALSFVTNEMVIGYRAELPASDVPTADSWPALLSREGMRIGHSDPHSDPCGYRALMVFQLAEAHYGLPGLATELQENSGRHIRPKASDLIALLEVGELDYAFLYRSVAVQHGVPFLALPDGINLRDPSRAADYAEARVEVTGREPGETIVKVGMPMEYGITIPRGAPNPELALQFVEYLLQADGGLAILQENGQPSLVPAPTATYDQLPERLKAYARPASK